MTLKFLAFLSVFALLIGTLIYWREESVRDQISFLHVILWQIGIWIPWVIAFPVFEKIYFKSENIKFGKIMLLASSIFWIGMHYTWFFYFSSNYSPYLGMPATGYGVYPYFFIFWTILDIGLMSFVLGKLKKPIEESDQTNPIVFELTRGDKKYFCKSEQIHWLSAEDYYTKLYTDQGIFLVRKRLKDFHEKLPQGDFKRIHRSTVINVNYVSGLARSTNDSHEVILVDGTKRRISRSYSKEIRAFFKDRSL